MLLRRVAMSVDHIFRRSRCYEATVREYLGREARSLSLCLPTDKQPVVLSRVDPGYRVLDSPHGDRMS